jgi:anti-anti-sigma factor
MATAKKKSQLNVRVGTRENKSAHVVIEGSMDAHTFPLFQQSIVELTEGGTLFLVLDLRSMTYIASVGINFLINLRVQRRKSGGEVILVDPQPNVLKILKMLGLLEVLVVAPTVEAAWSQMRAKIKPDAPTASGEVPLIE